MRVFGCLVVQDEADVLPETLEHLRRLRVFDELCVFDLGSRDRSLETAREFPDVVTHASSVDAPYTEGLREELLLGRSSRFSPGDWLAIVDADEFYDEDPRRLLAIADAEGADSLTTYQMEFAFTDLDLDRYEREGRRQSVRGRLRHYLVDWSEERFYRFRPDRAAGPLSSDRPCSLRLLNRHYPLRSPRQIETRIRNRIANRLRTAHLPRHQPWRHVFSADWRAYVRPARLFHLDDGGPPRFGLPPGVTVRDYRRDGDPFAEELPALAVAFERERSALDRA